jgi:hypothetical protein
LEWKVCDVSLESSLTLELLLLSLLDSGYRDVNEIMDVSDVDYNMKNGIRTGCRDLKEGIFNVSRLLHISERFSFSD